MMKNKVDFFEKGEVEIKKYEDDFDVEITYVEKRKIFEYAIVNYVDFKANGRTDKQRKRDLAVGTLGERIFKKYFEYDAVEVQRTLKKADPGWDFTIDDIKIDVKTIAHNYDRVYFNIDYMRCDYYCAVKVLKNDNGFLGQIVAFCSHKDATKTYKSHFRYGKTANYIPLRSFNISLGQIRSK